MTVKRQANEKMEKRRAYSCVLVTSKILALDSERGVIDCIVLLTYS